MLASVVSPPVAGRTLAFDGFPSTMEYRPAESGAGGCAVVFLHGLLGDSSQWRVLDEHVDPTSYADTFYVDYHYEQRARPPTFEDIVRETRACIAAARECASASRLVLVGSSFGGNLALYLAAHGLTPADRLVLFAPGGIPEVAQRRSLLQSFRTVNSIIHVSFDRLFGDPRVKGNPTVRRFLEAYRAKLEPCKRRFVRNMLTLSRTLRNSVLSAADLARVRARTLLVWGRQDIVTPPDLCELFHARIPRSRVCWVDSGHAAHVECPRESSHALRDFCVAGV